MTAAGEDAAPPDVPPLAERAAHLAGAVGRFVASGCATAPPEERARRLAICDDCPLNLGGRCRLCSCYLRGKTKMASEKCPINKW